VRGINMGKKKNPKSEYRNPKQIQMTEIQMIKKEKLQITMSKNTNKKLIKSFCGGVQGGQFFQKAPPLAAGGKNG
jgi:hypothetical protein